MKKIKLLPSLLFLIFISCEQNNISEEETLKTNFNYIDSTYVSFEYRNEEIRIDKIDGGMSSYYTRRYQDKDYMDIGFGAENYYYSSENFISIKFYFRISQKEFDESDSVGTIDLNKVSNFHYLIEKGSLNYRNDYLKKEEDIGVKLTIVTKDNKNPYPLTTYIEQYPSIIPPFDETTFNNSIFVIDEKIKISERDFFIKGHFSTKIYSPLNNSVEEIKNGKFQIFMNNPVGK